MDLVELLRSLGLDVLADLVAAWEASLADGYDGDPVATDDLATIVTGLRALAANDDPAVTAAVLVAAADIVDAAEAEGAARAETAAAAQAELDEARARLAGEAASDTEPEPADEPADTEPEPEPEEEPADEAALEPALVAAGTSTTATPARVSITRAAARRPAARAPRPPAETAARPVARAVQGVEGFNAGQELDDDQVSEALAAMARAHVHGAGPMRLPVVRLSYEVDQDRHLGGDLEANRHRIHVAERATLAARSGGQAPLQALVAAGGLCAPLTPLYDQATLATDARPVRDSLAGFDATRGGITLVPTLGLPDGDWADGLTIHTVANDESGATKNVLTIDCPDPVSVEVQAIVQILQVGNMRSMTFPEQVAMWRTNLAAAHARLAEQQLLASIDDDSEAVTTTSLADAVGASRAFLATLDLKVSLFRSSQRMTVNDTLAAIVPSWLRSMFRADLVASGTFNGTTDEALAMADAQFDAFFDRRNVMVTESLDSQVLTGDTAGNDQDWPDEVVWRLFAPGAHLFLRAPELNLGLVRDSTLNSTNDLQYFAETFEATAFRGPKSLRYTTALCPTGAASGLNDPADFPCTTGT